ncbi:hypothetical protein [Mycobacterium sp. IDR2000157661]|uniref:hypothetical protein n=1 Tax=Mycobacterium sp. IDR2000157661 TaxID=2867005 RepID=UPI001EEACDAF|nr:hypothetical protein [Mycobacterium sp. IDR2000157661]ULE32586.1 hypothetical protein K3G64_21215 [Mycobacterium sp. IDR2000157661]
MSRRSAIEQSVRAERVAAIRACRRCDPNGWRLGPDHTPVDPARRCDHCAPATPPAVRDITEPIYQIDDTEE